MHISIRVLFLPVVLAAAPAQALDAAGEHIARCRDASGGVIYTDKPCAALGASEQPMPAAMRMRLQQVAKAPGSTSAPTQPRRIASEPGPRGPQALGCARTADQLSANVKTAVAAGDVNLLAQSYHWVGQSNRQALGLMQQLEQLASNPVIDARVFDAQIFGSAGPGSQAQGARAGIMQLQVGELQAPRLVDMDVVRYAGCYFARF